MKTRLSALLIVAMAVVGIAAADVSLVQLAEDRAHARVHDQKVADRALPTSLAIPTEQTGPAPCVDGMALDTFPCRGIDLLSFTPLADLGFVNTDQLSGGGASDIWGWTSPDTGRDYVLMGHTNGTAAVDVTDPAAPVYLGSIPNTAPVQLIWHDIKVVNDHALIVSESYPHGMQILDLRKLDGLDGSTAQLPILFDGFYAFSAAQHNVVVNDDSDTAYIVGGSLGVPLVIGLADECGSGLNALDMADPLNPVGVGCYDARGYVHDAHCLTYPADGPDVEHVGKEICATFSEEEVEIVDMTDPAAPQTLSTFDVAAGYPDPAYTHQGWFSEDLRYIVFNDELDEQASGHPTRSLVLDTADLDAPRFVGAFTETADGEPRPASIDHNNYIHRGLVFQSNYTSGLRVSDVAALDEAVWDEVAFFDTFPDHDEAVFQGTWSNYPYFTDEQGGVVIAVSGIDEGLFMVRLQDGVLGGDATSGDGASSTHYARG